MLRKRIKRFKLIPLILITSSFLGINIYYLLVPTKELEANILLKPTDTLLTSLGRSVYPNYCASCHRVNLEGQPNWRHRDIYGYLPAPPHDETGHTWHHSDENLFLTIKYGIKEMIGKKYQNNMPAYKDVITDTEIIAVLSLIKFT